jgi:hypothetical protein
MASCGSTIADNNTAALIAPGLDPLRLAELADDGRRIESAVCRTARDSFTGNSLETP